MRTSIRSIALVLAAAAFAAGCASDEKLNTPSTTVNTPLLARYVAMGNSITAGMQSAGISDSTQRRAYPVLLAQMAGVPFTYPSLGAGCPALYTTPLNANKTLSATIPGGCAFRTSFTGFVNNLAVPNTYVADLTATGGTTGAGANNPLSTFILGGLNQTQAMAAEQPTFVSLWAPNNDILAAVNAGDTTLAPTAAAYLASFNAAAAAIKAVASVKGAVLIGVVDVPRVAPIVQPGAFFFAAANNPAAPNPFGKPVDLSCSPFTATGQPNPFGSNFVSLHAALDPTVTVIKCTPDSKYVTTTSTAGAAGGGNEFVAFETRIATINAGIKATADANGWIYVDPNAFLGATALLNTTFFKKCQTLGTATDLASFQAAVATSCPGNPTNYFGTMVSFDATHPSSLFHQQFAVYLAQQINAKYGTSIPTNPPAVGVFAR